MGGVAQQAPAGGVAAPLQLEGEHQHGQLRLAVGRHRAIGPPLPIQVVEGDDAGWDLLSNAAHPGYARTELIANGPGVHSPFAALTSVLGPLISQSAADGALPTLFAATSPEAVAGGYYGPSHMFEMKGPPKRARVAAAARDTAAASRLWEVSEKLTGVSFG